VLAKTTHLHVILTGYSSGLFFRKRWKIQIRTPI